MCVTSTKMVQPFTTQTFSMNIVLFSTVKFFASPSHIHFSLKCFTEKKSPCNPNECVHSLKFIWVGIFIGQNRNKNICNIICCICSMLSNGKDRAGNVCVDDTKTLLEIFARNESIKVSEYSLENIRDVNKLSSTMRDANERTEHDWRTKQERKIWQEWQTNNEILNRMANFSLILRPKHKRTHKDTPCTIWLESLQVQKVFSTCCTYAISVVMTSVCSSSSSFLLLLPSFCFFDEFFFIIFVLKCFRSAYFMFLELNFVLFRNEKSFVAR